MDNVENFDYYLSNHLGNITQRAASDPFAQIVSQSLGVGPFCCLLRDGLSRCQTLLGYNSGTELNKPAKPKVRYTYTGREWDPETLLYYYRARWYSPTMGRFLERDPLGYVDGPGLYEYVGNAVLIYIDPYGLIVEKCCLSVNPVDFWSAIGNKLGFKHWFND